MINLLNLFNKFNIFFKIKMKNTQVTYEGIRVAIRIRPFARNEINKVQCFHL